MPILNETKALSYNNLSAKSRRFHTYEECTYKFFIPYTCEKTARGCTLPVVLTACQQC